MPDYVLITGANRGIGLEFVRQYLAADCFVFAGCRSPERAKELQKLAGENPNLRLVELDVSDADSIAAVMKSVEEITSTLQVLINNAGVFAVEERGISAVRMEEMLRVFRVNYFGPLLMTQAALPLLTAAGEAKVAILTSRTGALRPPPVTDSPGSQFSYGCSKAAVHRMIPILGADLRPHNIVVAGLDPGWVRTDMTGTDSTGDRYQLEPEESVRGMKNVLDQLDISETGCLWRFDGSLSRWYAPTETPEERQIRQPASS